MSFYATNIELWNAVLARLGEDPISINDGSAEDALFRSNFDQNARRRLEAHATGFARKSRSIVKKGTSGDTPLFAYELPADLLKLHKVTLNGCPVERYEMRGDVLLSDIDNPALIAHYTWQAPVSSWSGRFVEAIMLDCEAMLQKLYERSAEARQASMLADRHFLDAQAVDRNQSPAVDRNPTPLMVAARRGVRSRY